MAKAATRSKPLRLICARQAFRREDFTLCIPDQSFDISLYLMDQKGFCISQYDFAADSNIVQRFANKNIKYVVVSDTLMERERAV